MACLRFPIRSIKKFWYLPSWQKRQATEALLLSVFLRVILSIVPFKNIAHFLGQQSQSSSKIHLVQHQELQAEQIKRSLKLIGRITKWRNLCLVNAIAGKWMLYHRGVQSELNLGLGKDNHNQLIAHAWLICGENVVTGEHAYKQFTVVAKFY